MGFNGDVEPYKLHQRAQTGLARIAMSGHEKQATPDVSAPTDSWSF
jgi:hypothetical protein